MQKPLDQKKITYIMNHFNSLILLGFNLAMEGHYHSTTGHSRPPLTIRLPARMGITEDKPSRLLFRRLPYLFTLFQIKHNRMTPVSPAFLSPKPLLLAHPARELGSLASRVPRSSISGTNLSR